MKHFLLCLALGLVGLTGCLPSFQREKTEPVLTPVAEVAPPVVTPDQVSEGNAANSVKALKAEMQFDLSRRSSPPQE